MLVLTVQSYRNIQKIYNESYIPDLRKSRYAYLSTRYLRGYMYNIESLSKKTGIGYRYGLDSCMWGWVKNPYLPFYYNSGNIPFKDRMYAVFFELNESESVLSDYDKYCRYVENESNENFFIDSVDQADCVQCCFWGINPKNIKLIVELDKLRGTNISEMLNCNKLNDSKFLFNSYAVG